jgi:hypothetical protein
VAQVSVPDHQARASAPVTPHAAHSVAVAQPRISDRKMSRMSRMQGRICADSGPSPAQAHGGSPAASWSGSGATTR